MSRTQVNNERLLNVLKKPIITEKASLAVELNQYTFEVVRNATKIEIRKAMEELFPGRKVKKVRTIYRPSHEKRVGTKQGRTQSSKKAIVTLDGEPLEDIIGA